MKKLANTVLALRNAAHAAATAADRLEAQDGYHLPHARGLIQTAEDQLARAGRQVDRAQRALALLLRDHRFRTFDDALAHIVQEERGS